MVIGIWCLNARSCTFQHIPHIPTRKGLSKKREKSQMSSTARSSFARWVIHLGGHCVIHFLLSELRHCFLRRSRDQKVSGTAIGPTKCAHFEAAAGKIN